MRGIVRGFDSEMTKVFVAHEEVVGVMPEMTMSFSADSASLAPLRVGDAVAFVLNIRRGRSWISEIERVPLTAVLLRSPLAVVDSATARPGIELLAPGSPFPPSMLVDQAGETLQMPPAGYGAVVVDYIYTRCPLPDYCLLLSARFRELQELLADRDVLLVSITLDPEFDTADVLERYGRRYNADYERWRFATGSSEDLAELYAASGVNVYRDGAMLDHNLATLLLDSTGTVTRIWRDTDATPDAVMREIELTK
jgi:protein SCO1/2